ncbi:MAG: riboflavin biosynthesis protein RibF [Dehalococcoidales bacterium]|jgi:riboflavin kinase/FMN adenylyltransferase|nr:riboflavin biosynthesis protein RibF [Dehalococcoidales bacterium]|tara:strand:- start:2531 stop:3457 length:927 start_codon:yes stop_codon:yes gene_type:complete
MSLEEELAGLSPKKETLLSVGVFDGVHLGHKHLFKQLTRQAREQNLISGVITFKQHPQEVLSPQTKLRFLTSLEQRIRLIKNEGVKIVITLSFTLELAQMNARQFVSHLEKHLGMRGVIIGSDFTLGRNREGNIDTLRTLGQTMDFSVTVVPPATIHGEVVSSTAIRNALARGDMKKVNDMFGHYFNLEGHVITGSSRGVELGFPTANLNIDPQQALPADGVYATWSYNDNHAYQSVTNIGKRPTFGSGERTVEVHILDYQGNLYRQELKIDIIERLRGEKKFSTAEELKKQIVEDIKQSRIILKGEN